MKKKQQQGYAVTGPNPNYKSEKRQSISPTFDSRDTGPAYYVITSLNDKRIGKQEIEDPFINTTINVSWKDLLKSLITRRGMKVSVFVNSPDRQRIEDVMELNANYLGFNSTRRDEWNSSLSQRLQDHVTRQMGEE